jgi:NADH-quinone oxidoreductase subunit I
MSIVRNLAGIAKGMSITMGEIFEPTQVENYPDGKGPLRGAVFEQRFRGKHVLQRDENGLEKCVACFLCAAACPSNCIFIEAAENTEEQRISSSERYAKVYNIDYNRCIFCGYCVEACPTDAITHGHGFELATLNATNLIMRKQDMLVPVEALTESCRFGWPQAVVRSAAGAKPKAIVSPLFLALPAVAPTGITTSAAPLQGDLVAASPPRHILFRVFRI